MVESAKAVRKHLTPQETNQMKTKSERRIEIIQDAVAQLLAQVYRTGSYGYLQLPGELSEERQKNPDNQAQSLLCDAISKEKYCGVCAKGSLFLSTIRKENDLKLKNLVDSHISVMDRLTQDELFNRENLNLVEAYYENWRLYPYERLDGWSVRCYVFVCPCVGFGFSKEQAQEFASKHNVKIAEFAKQYPAGAGDERTHRLIAILNNMLENEGVFEPLK
jgi:hypothetical protein